MTVDASRNTRQLVRPVTSEQWLCGSREPQALFPWFLKPGGSSVRDPTREPRRCAILATLLEKIFISGQKA
jgi:hypothetical protein